MIDKRMSEEKNFKINDPRYESERQYLEIRRPNGNDVAWMTRREENERREKIKKYKLLSDLKQTETSACL